MYIGYMGDIVFIVSSHYFVTPTNYVRSGESRWAQHDLILRKPVSQFSGPGLEKLSFDIILKSDLGASPGSILSKLRKMRDTGAVFPLIIGGQPVSQNYWRLDSLNENEQFYDLTGNLIQAKASVQLTEYDDSNYTEENSVINKYGTIFNAASTLLGGAF